MPYTDEEIERAAQLAEDFDPDAPGVTIEHTPELPLIAQLADAVRATESALRASVELARSSGRSWNQIALSLGVSPETARQRFADKMSVGER